jgi:hypothetical protein
MSGPSTCAINERSMLRSSFAWLASLAVACCALAWPTAGRAEGRGTFDFAWIAPDGCPSPVAVRAEIDALLKGAARSLPRENLTVQATVERGALWLVTLETQSGTSRGHRRIEAATCQGLANATALIVALMIDPDAVAARGSESEASEPPPVAVAVEPEAGQPRPRSPRATFGLAGLCATGSLGILPAPDVGVGAHIGLLRRHFRVELRGAFGAREVRSAGLAVPPGAYGRFRSYSALAAGCWAAVWPAIELGPCANLELGLLHGVGVGASQTATRNAAWFALGAGGMVVVKATPRLHFPVHLDAMVPLLRPNFVFTNVEGRIFRPWLVGMRLTLGVELQF